MLECPNCRQTFPAGTRFCGFCGTALSGTVPAAGSPDRGYREPLASSQKVPGFQIKGSPEDTLVRTKPDGFSWQSPHTHLLDNEPYQASGFTCAAVDVEESGGVARSPKAPGEHLPFAIPARPGRAPVPVTPMTQSPDTPLEVTSLAFPARALQEDRPGNQTLLSLSGAGEEAPIDYAAFSSTINEAALDTLIVPVSEPSTGEVRPIACPFEETFISADLLREIATLSASLPDSSLPDSCEEKGKKAQTPAQTMTSTHGNTQELPAAPFVAEPSLGSVPTEVRDEASKIATPTPHADAHTSTDIDTIADEEDDDISTFPTAPDSKVRPVPTDELDLDPAAFFAPFFKPGEVPEHLRSSSDPYLHLKKELASQRIEITTAMDELLPFVYDNHREENQALFAHILAHRPALDDEAWGHAAFVLGAYGNYMYRNPLGFAKKLEIWRAQLWAVYYERSYRRKYLAQRCQQLIHFFQGCAEHPTFLAIALHDLETLYLYLEPGSLRKLQQMLQGLPGPPFQLLQGIEAHMEVAEQEKAERMARQSPPTQQSMLTSTHKPATPTTQAHASRLAPRSSARASASERGVYHAITDREQAGEQEEAELMLFSRGQKWLNFLSEEQQQQFFACLRADQLEEISHLLLQGRTHILADLHTELLRTLAAEYQRPRKSVPVRLAGRNGPDNDRFAEAFRLLNSPKLKDQQTALRMFEQNMYEASRQEQQQGAREWMLYARALVQGSTRVAPDWERNFRKEEASWEEIWNLAYYHRVTNDQAGAIRVLAPGLNALDAPVSHLRLALICALTLLLEEEQGKAPMLQDARTLLIHHLERWPHPLSCLAWLVLNYETPGALRPLDQSRRLSVFQELLEYPVDLPDPRTELTEAQVSALQEALVSRTHCEEAWFLWLNDYAARRPHNFSAWQRLSETSERMERLGRAEMALQHIAGIYYDLDYVYAQEGEEAVQAAEVLRRHIEKLFEFYRRHEMQRQAWDSFESCYVTLKHLGFWDEQRPANRHLLTLVRPFLLEYQRQDERRMQEQRLAEAQDARARSEIRRNELSNNPTKPLEHFKSGRRVGIFVDYENIARLIPPGEDMENVWQMLASYAAQFGDVVCRWASASPRNLTNLTDVRAGLEAAQFKIRYPRRELQFSASQKDLADYALLECINNASLNDRLDVYLVVSGDRDYYERIYSLLEDGRMVRILASDCNLSSSYRELVQQRQRKHELAGDDESDFFIDDLTEVLHSLPPASN